MFRPVELVHKRFLMFFKYSSMNQIKSVIAISRIQANMVESVKMKGKLIAKVDLEENASWEDIQIKVPAKLSIINKVEGNQSVWQHQLTFLSCQQLDTDGHWCYLVSLADGQTLLMGTMTRPYVVTTSSISLTDNVTDNQLTEYTAAYNSKSRIPSLTFLSSFT